MQTPQNLRRTDWVTLPKEYWEKSKKRRLAREEKRFQEILEARKRPPHGKKVFDFTAFSNLYERPSELHGRVSISDLDKDGQNSYEWRFYFDDTFELCKDEESFANRMYEIDEVR